MSRLCPIKPLLRQLGDNAYRASPALISGKPRELVHFPCMDHLGEGGDSKLGIAVTLKSGPIALLVQRECDRSGPKYTAGNGERALVPLHSDYDSLNVWG